MVEIDREESVSTGYIVSTGFEVAITRIEWPKNKFQNC